MRQVREVLEESQTQSIESGHLAFCNEQWRGETDGEVDAKMDEGGEVGFIQ